MALVNKTINPPAPLFKGGLRGIFYLFFLLHLTPLYSEAFGNNSVTIPKLGMTFFDVPFLPNKKPWGITYQWTIGTSFMRAIDYHWWWVIETNVGFGKLAEKNHLYIGTFSGGAGVRLNLLERDIRPHIEVMLNYLHFLGNNVKFMPLNLGWPIFVGLKPVVGVEWLFYSEMALILNGSYTLYVNINEPIRHTVHTSLAFAIYF